MKDKDQQLIWESYRGPNPDIANEEWTEDDQRDKMEHMSRDEEGWPVEDHLDVKDEIIFKAAAEYLSGYDRIPERYDDLGDDGKNEMIDAVTNALHDDDRYFHQYTDDEEDHRNVRELIDNMLFKKFDELIDTVEDRAVERGDRPPLDSGVDPRGNPYGKMDKSDPHYDQIRIKPEEYYDK